MAVVNFFYNLNFIESSYLVHWFLTLQRELMAFIGTEPCDSKVKARGYSRTL